MRQEHDINRDWALRLAGAAIAVFPCGPDKKPLIRWREFSSCDADAVAMWWTQFPNALPGIDLEKNDLLVLDGDRHGGADGRAALRELLQQQPDYNASATPRVLTPNDGAHVYFTQNGHELRNARGNLPDGIDVRGCGGYVICPYAVLPDGRRYRAVSRAADLITAYLAGTIPPVPQGVVDLIEARKNNKPHTIQLKADKSASREKAYALAALEGCTKELAAAAQGGRNELLNKLAFRLGRMIGRGWLYREHAEANLIGAMHVNGYVTDKGIRAAEATLRSGLDAGEKEPHPDLVDNEESENKTKTETAPVIEPWPIERVLEIFERWLILPSRAPVYAVLGTIAANQLAGDPVWLGLIAPPSSAKTEILNSVSVLPYVYQAATLTPAALLSGVPKKQHHKTAMGGLLRQIGDFGIISLKDFGSILSMRPDAKAEILAALRELFDGAWTRHLGTDGGRTLSWRGKVGLIFGCTGVIDSHYSIISAMGDRFLLNRLSPCDGQFKRALEHSGAATVQMRKELTEAVAHLFANRGSEPRRLSDEEFERLDRRVSLVVRLRGAVERDRQSREVEAIYGAEGTARLGLTLERLLAGLDTLGLDRALALDVVEAIAMDSVPPTRRRAYEFLQDIAPAQAETAAVAKDMGLPTVTVRRALEELAAYGLVERTGQGQGKPDLWCAT
jgi:hypothetical protein